MSFHDILIRTRHIHIFPWCWRSGLYTTMFSNISVINTLHNHVFRWYWRLGFSTPMSFYDIDDQYSAQGCLSMMLAFSTLRNDVFPWCRGSGHSTIIPDNDIGAQDSPLSCVSMILAIRSLHYHVFPWCRQSGISTTMSFHSFFFYVAFLNYNFSLIIVQSLCSHQFSIHLIKLVKLVTR